MGASKEWEFWVDDIIEVFQVWQWIYDYKSQE